MSAHITEDQFNQQVYELARFYHWRVYRTHDSRHSPAGYPDLSMVRRDRHAYAELKSEKGKLTPEQRAWLLALYEAGHEVFVWKPSDWPEIVDVLAVGRRMARGDVLR